MMKIDKSRKQVGYLVATVKFPLYEGDKIDRDYWPDFEYREPGIRTNNNGTASLGVCVRTCDTIEAKVEKIPL